MKGKNNSDMCEYRDTHDFTERFLFNCKKELDMILLMAKVFSKVQNGKEHSFSTVFEVEVALRKKKPVS